MNDDKIQTEDQKAKRKKITLVLVVVVVLIVIWMASSLFSSDEETPPEQPIVKAAQQAQAQASSNKAAQPGAPGQPGAPAAANVPQAAELKPQPAQLSPREQELLRQQQESEARYVNAVNELQMLKVAKDMAEATQAIVSAKLATVQAQKNIVDLLTPPAPKPTPGEYGQGLVNPGGTVSPTTAVQPSMIRRQEEEPYTVISVSQIQNRWNAVIGYQQTLYSVTIGDVLSPDGSKVVSIDRSGVMLDKKGSIRKISLLPII